MKVTVYVPRYQDTEHGMLWKRIARQASELFGGYTRLPASGGWVSPEGELIEEHIDLVYTYTDPDDPSTAWNWIKHDVVPLILGVGEQSVLIDTAGQPHFYEVDDNGDITVSP